MECAYERAAELDVDSAHRDQRSRVPSEQRPKLPRALCALWRTFSFGSGARDLDTEIDPAPSGLAVDRAEAVEVVQVPGYAISRLEADVVFRDNGSNIAATDLPVPSVSDALGGM